MDGDGAEPGPRAPDPDVSARPDPGDGTTRRGEGGRLPAGNRLDRVCAGVLSQAGVDGAGITVMGSLAGGLRGARDQVAATSVLARRLEELQLTAGEGPCLDAYLAGVPVLVADLAAESTRWLGFAPEALAAGAAAVFSLPLQVGAVRLGTLDLYRTRAEGLSRPQLAEALAAAESATEAVLAAPDPEVGDAGWLPGVHAEVHVASGMVSARAGVDVGTALLRLRGHAFAHGMPLHEVARRVIERSLVLDTTDTPATDTPATDDRPHDAPAPSPDPEDGHE